MKAKIVSLGAVLLFAFYSQFDYQPGSWVSFCGYAQEGYFGYPMPGIVGLIQLGYLLGSVNILMLSLSLVAYLSTIVLFYKLFEVKPNYWHIILFLPLAAIMAVKTNHALTPFFLIAAGYLFKKERFWASALVASLAYWFRSELILAPFLYGLIARKKEFILVPLVSVGLWFSITGQTGTTNNGAVLYISQFVTKNPWNKEATDAEAFDLAEKWGAGHAWKPETQSIFLWRILALIREDPGQFVKSTLAKIGRVPFTRLYIANGEFGGFLMGALGVLFSAVIWFPLLFKRHLTSFWVFVLVFPLSELLIGGIASTMITNNTYLFLAGNALYFYSIPEDTQHQLYRWRLKRSLHE